MLQIKNLSFSYSDVPVLKDLNFKIEKGEHVSIIGASGCGKSTLLQAIYGLHHVEGSISWNGEALLGPNFNIVPGEDFIKYLTQDFDLMPPLSVADNVGKYLSNAYPVKKRRRIAELLDLVEMRDMAEAKAGTLSGGQQQRVALARVLAKPPEILLLDEPFSHIDHFRKNKLRRDLFAHLKKMNITVLVATHDSTDALSFADKTMVMDSGEIIAIDRPIALYNDPVNAYTASLFGEVNTLPISLFKHKETTAKEVILYPHEINLTTKSHLRATVKNNYFKGSYYLIEVQLQDQKVFLRAKEEMEEGSSVFLKISEDLINRRSR